VPYGIKTSRARVAELWPRCLGKWKIPQTAEMVETRQPSLFLPRPRIAKVELMSLTESAEFNASLKSKNGSKP
jgi:hypothetical protein